MARRSQNGAPRVLSEGNRQHLLITLTAQQLADLHAAALQINPALIGALAIPLGATAILRLDGATTVTIPQAINLFCGSQSLLAVWTKTTATTADHVCRTYPANADHAAADLAAALTLQTAAAILIQGEIKTSAVGNGGSGWAEDDTFTVPGGVAGVVDTVNAGAVTAYTLTNKGSTVTVGNGKVATATSGGGTGLTLNVTAVGAQANPITLDIDIEFLARRG